MPITDIAGAYCPQGCGQTLHLMASGMIKCLGRNCPDPGTVQKILSDPETLDIVTFRDGHFNVQHPLRERLGGALLDCPVTAQIARMLGAPGAGRYRALIDEDGDLILHPVPGG